MATPSVPPRQTFNQTKGMDPDDPTNGSIEYRSNTEIPPKGFFVSTYYFRDTECPDCNVFKGQDSPWVKTDIYKTGLLHYLKVTESPEFLGWKLLIYTDQTSVEKPVFKPSEAAGGESNPRYQKHLSEWNQIATHPNVVFGVVTWPEYAVGAQGDGKTIDNAILRALRMKAFHDFPDTPVFVRDADTLFENIVKVRDMSAELAAWEAAFKRELERITTTGPYKIVIASQPNYHRQWHVHPDTGVTTTGCYAAVTSSLGDVPEWKNGALWRGCLKYFRDHTKIIQEGVNRVPSNLNKPTYIGKDEQLLSYVVLPTIFEKVYFYYLEYIQVEGTAIEETAETPFAKVLLEKGYSRYPSPYIEVLGEALPPLDERPLRKRKDENTKTEETLLKPEIIPRAFSSETHQILQIIFRYFLDEIKKKQSEPGFVPLQLGGYRIEPTETAADVSATTSLPLPVYTTLVQPTPSVSHGGTRKRFKRGSRGARRGRTARRRARKGSCRRR